MLLLPLKNLLRICKLLYNSTICIIFAFMLGLRWFRSFLIWCLAIHCRYVKPPIFTLCVGNAWGEASLLLAAGARGNRSALPSSTIMIKQVSSLPVASSSFCKRWAFICHLDISIFEIKISCIFPIWIASPLQDFKVRHRILNLQEKKWKMSRPSW